MKKFVFFSIIFLTIFLIYNKEIYAENEELESNEITEEKKNEETNNQYKANEIEETEKENENETQEQEQQYEPVNPENVTEVIKAKSSNANLRNLGIEPYDFTGFRYGTTNYNVTVPQDTDSVEVYAEVQDSKSIVTGTGKKTLDNVTTSISVVVTAEDGTKKTYTINITKDEIKEENNTTTTNTISEESNSNNINVEEKSEGLASLKINGLALIPDFKTNIYEYNVKYIGKEEKLDIEVEPTNIDYIVDVAGNTNLKEGENIITILVSDKNGKNIATYQITVNKSFKGEIVTTTNNNQKYLISAGIIGAVILIIVFVFILKRKRNADYYYEYDEEDDDEYTVNKIEENRIKNKQDYEEELPKSLRNKQKFESKYDYKEITKEDARKNFLDGYNNEDYKEEGSLNKHKGKRFK